MKSNFRKGEFNLSFSIIALLAAAAVLTVVRTDFTDAAERITGLDTIAWSATYHEADFSSFEIRELVRQLHQSTRSDRDPDVLRPVILQLGVHIRTTTGTVPPVVADLLRDLSVEHPVRDIRLLAYTTMISALQNEDGEDDMAIGVALR